MVEYQNKWVPCLWLATFNNFGELESQYTNEKKRFEDLEKNHEKITNLRFEKVVFSDGQNQRLEEVIDNNIPENFGSEVRDYVKSGVLPEGYDHPLSQIKLKKERAQQKNDIDEAYQMVLESEGLI